MKNFKNIDVSENMEVKIPKSLLIQLFGLKKRTNTPLRDFLYFRRQGIQIDFSR